MTDWGTSVPDDAESPLGGDAFYPDEGLLLAIVDLRVLAEGGDELDAADEARHYAQALTALAQHAEAAQYLGLADIAVRLTELENASDERPRARRVLAQFAQAAADYVMTPTAQEAQEALLACLDPDLTGAPLSADEMDILRLMLGVSPDGLPEAPPPAPAHEDPLASLPLATQQVDSAVLAMLAEESHAVLGTLADLVRHAVEGSGGETADSITAVTSELESLARGAEYSGLAALARFLERMRHALPQSAKGDRAGVWGLLQSFLPVLERYLAQPTDAEAAALLAALLRDPAWGDAALAAEGAQRLATALAAVEIQTSAVHSELRPIEARPEDVSLALPEDLNPELLDGLLLELPIQSAVFAQATRHIVDGQGTREDIDIAKRAAHTLKGAANTVGVRGVAQLTHYLEDILVALSEHGALPNLGLSQTLSYAADCLEAMSEALIGTGSAPGDALNVLQDVLNWVNRIDAQGIDVARSEAPAPEQHAAQGEVARVSERDQPAAMLRVPAQVIDELLRLVGETITTTAQIQNRIAQTMQQARAISRQNTILQQLVAELETAVDVRGVHSAGVLAASATSGEFDALEFEEYNELQTLSRRLVEVATDSREMGLASEEHLTALGELLEQQNRLHLENQNAVLAMRMVPVGSVFSRLQRGVRQACRILDKQAELHPHGKDTVIDGNILHELIDALMHLLRNAVDHGIEPEQERLAAGKPAAGNIDLSFRREGDYITVRCADDGKGLDLAAIRAHAERRGIVPAGALLTDDEIARLILIPGFSTREEATQVSGRGIGMDAVNTKVGEFKGLLNLVSRPGLGLTVEIRLPVTLLSTHALLVRSRNKVIAISTRGVADIHYVSTGSIAHIGTAMAELTGGKLHEVVELEAVLDLPGDRRKTPRHGWPVLIVRLETGAERAVVVQEVLEGRGLVVKTLGPYVPKIQGLVGATILGDGSVAPVIDLPELLYSPTHISVPVNRAETAEVEETGALRQRRALVVDDSISARRSVAQALRDAGYEVRTAVDGLEAIGIVEQRVPDIVITDMEMPRMNGLELTQHLRARPFGRHLPVVMITSRSTEKHRRQAELAGVNVYLIKPFNDHELLRIVDSLVTPVP